MTKQKNWSRIMIGAVLVLILAIGGTAVLAQSQDDPDVTPPADTPTLPNPFSRSDNRGRPGFPGGHRGFPGRADGPGADENLADALGITVEELQTALEAIRTAALEQAVAGWPDHAGAGGPAVAVRWTIRTRRPLWRAGGRG